HSHTVLFFFSPHRHPPPPPLFPYTTLFRSPSPASASASANPTPARPGPMIPTTWGGNLIPQERRRLCRGQGEEILGRLGAARQRQRGPHLAVFLTLATHLRRPPEDVAREIGRAHV